MKISFVYGAWALGGRPLDFTNLWDSPRGLTGSELSCVMFAKTMAKRGHDVSLYTNMPNASSILNGGLPPVALHHMSWLLEHKHEIVYVWNEPDHLRYINNDGCKLRLVNQQLNDFNYCKPGFDAFVDIYTSPSINHRDFLQTLGHTTPGKWRVLPNGCDPTLYGSHEKDPNTVIYASSPDRGLHLLLQIWPLIKAKIKDAKLKVFYNLNQWFDGLTPIEENPSHDMRELGRRARYVQLALERFAPLDVITIGSISRNQIAVEMDQASVLAYPCDTVRYTEGFSVTTLEGCASGALPVICGVDALKTIYEDAVPMIEPPAREHLDQFVELMLRALLDRGWAASWREEAKELASNHTWDVLADRLETIIKEAL